MKKDSTCWALASSGSSRTRHPSFSSRSQTLFSSNKIVWDRARSCFASGHMGNYEFRFRYTDYQPCDPEMAKDILLYCSRPETKKLQSEGVYNTEDTCGRCVCAGKLVLFVFNGRQGSFGTSLSIRFYNLEGKVSRLNFSILETESFMRRMQKLTPAEIHDGIYGKEKEDVP